MKKIPKGFKKMGLELRFPSREVKVIERHVLRMLIRDYNIYYRNIPGDPWRVVKFYCRPKQEASITYKIGILMQAMFGFYSRQEIIRANHVVYENFPHCIHL